jgi:hypothetical protein
MEPGDAVVVDAVMALEAPPKKIAVYDREIGSGCVRRSRDERGALPDPLSGRTKAKLHRHTAAQTIVVLEGRLLVNGKVVGPGAYCHFPPGEPMLHAPTDHESCTFVTIFHGEADVEALD